MWKLSIDIAERKGALLRRALRSAERLSDSATARGRRRVKTPSSRSSALLVRITRADHRRALVLGMTIVFARHMPDAARHQHPQCQTPHASGALPYANLAQLVIVEGEAILEVAMLIVRVFVGPHRVPQRVAGHLQVEIVGSALERALGRGRRPFELVHLDVRAREVEAARLLVLIDRHHIVRGCDELAVYLNLHSLLEVFFLNLVVRPFLMSGRVAHVDLLVWWRRRSASRWSILCPSQSPFPRRRACYPERSEPRRGGKLFRGRCKCYDCVDGALPRISCACTTIPTATSAA